MAEHWPDMFDAEGITDAGQVQSTPQDMVYLLDKLSPIRELPSSTSDHAPSDGSIFLSITAQHEGQAPVEALPPTLSPIRPIKDDVLTIPSTSVAEPRPHTATAQSTPGKPRAHKRAARPPLVDLNGRNTDAAAVNFLQKPSPHFRTGCITSNQRRAHSPLRRHRSPSRVPAMQLSPSHLRPGTSSPPPRSALPNAPKQAVASTPDISPIVSARPNSHRKPPLPPAPPFATLASPQPASAKPATSDPHDRPRHHGGQLAPTTPRTPWLRNSFQGSRAGSARQTPGGQHVHPFTDSRMDHFPDLQSWLAEEVPARSDDEDEDEDAHDEQDKAAPPQQPLQHHSIVVTEAEEEDGEEQHVHVETNTDVYEEEDKDTFNWSIDDRAVFYFHPSNKIVPSPSPWRAPRVARFKTTPANAQSQVEGMQQKLERVCLDAHNNRGRDTSGGFPSTPAKASVARTRPMTATIGCQTALSFPPEAHVTLSVSSTSDNNLVAVADNAAPGEAHAPAVTPGKRDTMEAWATGDMSFVGKTMPSNTQGHKGGVVETAQAPACSKSAASVPTATAATATTPVPAINVSSPAKMVPGSACAQEASRNITRSNNTCDISANINGSASNDHRSQATAAADSDHAQQDRPCVTAMSKIGSADIGVFPISPIRTPQTTASQRPTASPFDTGGRRHASVGSARPASSTPRRFRLRRRAHTDTACRSAPNASGNRDDAVDGGDMEGPSGRASAVMAHCVRPLHSDGPRSPAHAASPFAAEQFADESLHNRSAASLAFLSWGDAMRPIGCPSSPLPNMRPGAPIPIPALIASPGKGSTAAQGEESRSGWLDGSTDVLTFDSRSYENGRGKAVQEKGLWAIMSGPTAAPSKLDTGMGDPYKEAGQCHHPRALRAGAMCSGGHEACGVITQDEEVQKCTLMDASMDRGQNVSGPALENSVCAEHGKKMEDCTSCSLATLSRSIEALRRSFTELTGRVHQLRTPTPTPATDPEVQGTMGERDHVRAPAARVRKDTSASEDCWSGEPRGKRRRCLPSPAMSAAVMRSDPIPQATALRDRGVKAEHKAREGPREKHCEGANQHQQGQQGLKAGVEKEVDEGSAMQEPRQQQSLKQDAEEEAEVEELVHAMRVESHAFLRTPAWDRAGSPWLRPTLEHMHSQDSDHIEKERHGMSDQVRESTVPAATPPQITRGITSALTSTPSRPASRQAREGVEAHADLPRDSVLTPTMTPQVYAARGAYSDPRDMLRTNTWAKRERFTVKRVTHSEGGLQASWASRTAPVSPQPPAVEPTLQARLTAMRHETNRIIQDHRKSSSSVNAGTGYTRAPPTYYTQTSFSQSTTADDSYARAGAPLLLRNTPDAARRRAEAVQPAPRTTPTTATGGSGAVSTMTRTIARLNLGRRFLDGRRYSRHCRDP